MNNVPLRTKIDAFHKMIVETFGDRIQRFATLFEGGGQAILVCSGNQLSPNGSCYNILLGFGTCTMGKFLELIRRNEGVRIENHVGVHNIHCIDEQRMFQKPSPNDQMVHVFFARVFDDKVDGDVIVGNRCVVFGPKCVGMTLSNSAIERLRRRDQCGITCRWSRDAVACEKGLRKFNRAEEGG